MPICTRCGSWNQDPAITCEKCGAILSPSAPAAGIPAQEVDLPHARSQKFFLFAFLFIASLVACVLFGKASVTKYDSSGPGVLDTSYTTETKTTNGSQTVTYKVTYKFEVQNTEYTGKDTLSLEPTSTDTTVYYMAGNPQDNSLTPGRAITAYMVAAGVAFLIALLSYWRLPKNYPFLAAASGPAAGIGDSGNEFRRMKRGKYGAGFYVHAAFFVELVWLALMAAFALAASIRADATSYTVLGSAVGLAGVVTLWIYADRWSCIEAFSSRFCSGLANFSIFYVPVVAFVYANYRGLKKLQGR